MRQEEGVFWDHPAEFKCVPVTGKLDGKDHLVLNHGISLEARKRFPNLPYEAGKLVSLYGNIAQMFREWKILTLPIKRNWGEPIHLPVLRCSAAALQYMAERYRIGSVAVPLLDGGLGGVPWSVVYAELAAHLDDRFVLVLPPLPKD